MDKPRLVRYVDDLVTVFQWDKRLYRVVLRAGFVLGFLLGVSVCALVTFLTWAVLS